MLMPAPQFRFHVETERVWQSYYSVLMIENLEVVGMGLLTHIAYFVANNQCYWASQP